MINILLFLIFISLPICAVFYWLNLLYEEICEWWPQSLTFHLPALPSWTQREIGWMGRTILALGFYALIFGIALLP